MLRPDIVIQVFLALALVTVAGCSKRPVASAKAPEQSTSVQASPSPPVDVCALLTPDEVKRIAGETPSAIKPTHTTGGGFEMSQCLYSLPTYSNSILISVTRRGRGPNARDPKEYWKKKIEHPEKGEQEEEEKPREPDRVTGVGDKAVWVGAKVGGALYFLKGDAFVRIAIGTFGGGEKREEKVVEIGRLVAKRM